MEDENQGKWSKDKLTSPTENYPSESYVLGKQQAVENVEDLLQYMHELEEPGAPPI